MSVDVEPLDHPAIPEDVEYIRDPLDRIVALLQQLVEVTIRGQNPAAGIRRFPFNSSLRIRAEWLVISQSAAGVVTFRAGPTALDQYQFAAADTKIIPFPVTLDNGIDYSLVASAGSVSGFVVGYPDNT